VTLSNHRENGDGERDGDGGGVQNVVRCANCTLQKLGKTVGWRWQNVTISEKMAAIHPKHFEEMEYFRV